MHDIFSREPDPLDAMLRSPAPANADELRRTVYAQTCRALHRRRRLRWCAHAAALAASFVAGLFVMRVSVTPAPAPASLARSASKEEAPPPDNPPAAIATTYEPALVREWQAFDSDNRRAELYRRAGEAYLKEENDPLSALRCYANALDNGTEQERTISPDDDWLLMAIKSARQKEKIYANQGG